MVKLSKRSLFRLKYMCYLLLQVININRFGLPIDMSCCVLGESYVFT